MVKKKVYSNAQVLLGFIELMRPLEWSKSLFNMTIGLLMAFYVFSAGVSIYLFGAGLIAIFLLWSGLYALNDWSDWKSDLLHKAKRIRAIPSGRVSPKNAFSFAIALLVISFAVGFAINNFLFLICMLVMFANQLLYTMKPLRLKDRKVFDIISGAFVNPIFRYLAGLFLFISLIDIHSIGFPVLPVMFVVGVQVGTYLTYRFSSKEHECKTKVECTVAKLSEHRAKVVSRFLILMGFFSMMAIIANYFLWKSAWLGFVPWHYVLAIIPGFFIAPLLRQVVKHPKKATDPAHYKMIYASFHITSDVIMICILLIFVLFP